MKIHSNSYYNYLKRKDENIEKDIVLKKIKELYHKYNGVCGHRMIKIYLEREGYNYSKTTVHKFMNKELKLKSTVRRKKPNYIKQEAHKVHENKLNRDFTANNANEKWCTDFTYIYLLNNDVRYNCTVIDLYDRSVVSSVCGKRMDTELAKRALNKAFKDNPRANKEIILHSDQGSQFTSKEFVKYCEEQGIIQSMSKAGCPYDNAVMERYYNTLKEEYLNNYIFEKEEDLYKGIEEFSYVYYNYVRPHSYNGYLTPMEVRRKK